MYFEDRFSVVYCQKMCYTGTKGADIYAEETGKIQKIVGNSLDTEENIGYLTDNNPMKKRQKSA